MDMNMKKMAQGTITLLAAAWLVGCGLSPQELCRQAVEAGCKKAAECSRGFITEQACQQQAKMTTDCDKSEPCQNGKYNSTQAQKCIDDFKATTCEQLMMSGGAPASCRTVCQ